LEIKNVSGTESDNFFSPQLHAPVLKSAKHVKQYSKARATLPATTTEHNSTAHKVSLKPKIAQKHIVTEADVTSPQRAPMASYLTNKNAAKTNKSSNNITNTVTKKKAKTAV